MDFKIGNKTKKEIVDLPSSLFKYVKKQKTPTYEMEIFI